MDKRYQVFVSSTYDDLRQERQEVMQALLELDCMPSGMELFPAADADQWTLIKQVISDCDYYLVIVAGRYGSTGSDGKSYTQMEYEYALSINKPVIGFLHANPAGISVGKSEQTEEGKKRLEQFRDLVKRKMVKFWSTPQELGSVVSRSIVKLIKSNPAVGWIRADEALEATAAQEILRLRKKIDELESNLSQAQLQPPPGAESLAKGEDEYSLLFETSFSDEKGEEWTQDILVESTWNEIFSTVAPLMIDRATDSTLRSRIQNFYHDRVGEKVREGTPKAEEISYKFPTDSYNTIKVQLRALGLMKRDDRQRSIKDTATYWTLTPYGDAVMTSLNAIPVDDEEEQGETTDAQPAQA